MRRPWHKLLGALAAATCVGGAWPQARFDVATQVLSVPTIDVGGQICRDLAARLDADGRLTIVALTAPPAFSGPSLATRTAAATTTAQNNAACTAIRPFYWEIGDKTQGLAGASVNAPGSAVSYDAASVMAIASASK